MKVGGVDLVALPLENLRTEVALVTQEHHVFVGTVRDNIILAREDSSDEAVYDALSAVGSRDWVERLPAGLDTLIGSGNQALTPAQAQQIALARLIIADPHTLVLDEATSLIDPRTARTLEGSMNALLDGRTVVAIAHRLHTAHDADRIAVVIDGKIVELGSHHELVEPGTASTPLSGTPGPADRRRVGAGGRRINAESAPADSALSACLFAPTRRSQRVALRRLGALTRVALRRLGALSAPVCADSAISAALVGASEAADELVDAVLVGGERAGLVVRGRSCHAGPTRRPPSPGGW